MMAASAKISQNFLRLKLEALIKTKLTHLQDGGDNCSSRSCSAIRP
jgi:hypothetical protein